MSFLRVPLWRQLLVVWGAALVLASALLWLDLREPSSFFWIVPYPSWRAWAPVIGGLFRVRPLLATALVGIPVVAILTSVTLCVMRLAQLRAGAQDE